MTERMNGKYGVVRHGEHVFPLPDTAEQAKADIERRRTEDRQAVEKGWLTEKGRLATRYWFQQVPSNVW